MRAHSSLVWAIVVGSVVAASSSCDGEGGGPDGGGDASTDGGDDGTTCAVSCADVCCDDGQVCFEGVCIDDVACAAGDTCWGDAYCEDGRCLPYGVLRDLDPSCTTPLVPGIFRAAVQCEWTAPPAGDEFPGYTKIAHTPLVADLGIGRGPDDPRHPSIIVATTETFDANVQGRAVIRIIDGATCGQVATISEPMVQGVSTPALGDLDGDGLPDVVAQEWSGGLVAWHWDSDEGRWAQLWRNAERVLTTPHALSLADLDDDGRPEIVAGGIVYGADGALLSDAAGEIDFPTAAWGHQVATIADVDLDEQLEVVQGDAIWTWSADAGGLVQEAYGGGAAPYSGASVADFGEFSGAAGDAPGLPEIAVDTAAGFQIQTVAGERVFGPYPIHTTLPLDLFSIGDVDGDGVPEVSAPNSYSWVDVFDVACVPGGGPGACASGREDGVLWRQDVIVETGGTSVFDFEGDGRAEVLYADWCYVRVVDGADGTVIWSGRRSSGGWHEMPVVADVDGDFHAEIVSVSAHGPWILGYCPAQPVDPYFPGLPCETDADCPSGGATCGEGLCRCAVDDDCGDPELACVAPLPSSPGAGLVCRTTWAETDGLRVYSDVEDRWAGSRMIWNQHAYSVTNVSDSGLVPRGSEMLRNWEQPGLNNFRQNVQLEGHEVDDSPDLTVGSPEAPACDTATATQPLSARVCNRGTLAVPAGVDVSFRVGSPDGEEVCSATTPDVLHEGTCVVVQCEWSGIEANTDAQVFAVVDADEQVAVAECDEGNNVASTDVRCPPSLQ